MLNRIAELYDRVWVYGPRRFWNPLDGLDVPPAIEQNLRYVGWLRRELPSVQPSEMHFLPEKYILVTAGGGGDGIAMMEQVLAAREHDWQNDYPIVLVTGPFMKSENRERIRMRASRLANVNVIDFEARLEALLAHAVGVVGMCGYNTFCEVLSFDRKALFIPRVQPRQEQYIRASRARELGLCEMLTPEEASIPDVMARALRRLPSMSEPSTSLLPDDMSGLDLICDDIEQLVSGTRIPANRRTQKGFRVATIDR
jgi:predicted glycosyltransferase